MRMLGRIVAAAVFAASGATAASAQIPLWTGFYAGVNGGWSAAFADHQPGTGSVQGLNDLNLNGALFGGELGYNWQLPSDIVLGIQASGDVGNVTGSCTSPNCHPSGAPSTMHTLSSFATFDGRVGFATGNFLPFVSGGFAVGTATRHTAYPSPNGQSFTNNHMGWDVGAGIEWMFAPQWSFRAEYQYMDLGTQRYSFAAGNQPIVHLTNNVFRVGLDWHM